MGMGPWLAVTAAALAGPAGAWAAATPAQIIATLNAQRAAAGLPAGITENADWSSACANHNEYMQAHDRQLSHGEPDTGSPTYTKAGDDVSKGAVLAIDQTWARGNPFETQPIHLHQLLAPRLSQVGADERYDFVCTTSFGPPPGAPGYGRTPSPAPAIATYPQVGATNVLPSEVALEGPFTPGELVGIPEGAASGRYLYVFVDGPWTTALPRVDVTKATLQTAAGAPVDVRIADVDVPTPDGHTLGDYLPEGAQLIPANPLAPGTTYQAHVELTTQNVPLTKTWTFTTAAAPAAKAPSTPAADGTPTLRIAPARHRKGALRFTVTASPSLVGRVARLTVAVKGRKTRRSTLKLKARHTLVVKARRATVTLHVDAFVTKGDIYPAITVRRTGRG